ncbi:hypothetical protein [Parapedobacter sp. 10938]|uniref:hypothetical protein n=1 Tax=Parapedobacter flavus TaxID=3110225 RepID=UPI002DBF02B7|nr:hypothetical protein [Parapedobacter sp. 10938]MEC3881594.1 hypothetical protein [Parapedobacter sp. 10938]
MASVRCGACGNGLQRSRQAEAPWALGCIPSAMPRGIERKKRSRLHGEHARALDAFGAKPSEDNS